MKNMKRTMTIVLALVMLLGMLPVAVQADKTTGQLEESEYGTPASYSITGLLINDSVATVTYTTLEDAIVVVTLYTEDEHQLLLSGSAAVRPGETTAAVTLEGEIPQYFEASACLVDVYDRSPLCEAYDTNMYRSDYRGLINGGTGSGGSSSFDDLFGDGSDGDSVVPTITPKYPSLSFEGEVFINVYFQIENDEDVVEMGLATSADSTVDETDTKVVGYDSLGGGMYTVCTGGIAAKNLGDTIYFRVYAKLADGTYVYSANTYSYSALAYAKDRLANSTNAKMKALAVAMLNYGAAAQNNFGYNTDNLMNASLTAEQLALVDAYRSDMVAGISAVDTSKVGQFAYNAAGWSLRRPSVSFEGAFSINYYFTPALAVDGEMTLYYWDLETYNSVGTLTTSNATGSMTMTNVSGIYEGNVSGIAAKEIDSTIFVAGVYESNGVSYSTGVLNYSLGAYCVDRINKSTDATMVAFAKATAVYGYYAKKYFAVN